MVWLAIWGTLVKRAVEASQINKEVRVQGDWRSTSHYWMLMELKAMKDAGQHLSMMLFPPAPLWDTNRQEPPHESVSMIGVLTMPTLSGGMQRWNR
jgi:hypothetical protein